MTTPNALTVDAEMQARLDALLSQSQTFTPPPPEPEPEHLVVEYHSEPGHDTRDVLATTLLTRVLARTE